MKQVNVLADIKQLYSKHSEPSINLLETIMLLTWMEEYTCKRPTGGYQAIFSVRMRAEPECNLSNKEIIRQKS